MKMWKVLALAMVFVVTCSAIPAMADGPRNAGRRGPAWRHPHAGPPRGVYRPPVMVPRYVPVYPMYRPRVVPAPYYYGRDHYHGGHPTRWLTPPGVSPVGIPTGGVTTVGSTTAGGRVWAST